MKDHFSIDARTVLALGRESIKDHTTAILELVKNSYDAGATAVRVEVFQKEKMPFVRIADNGCGMDESDVENFWLRIGYSQKRKKAKSSGRTQIGEKGVGRLSADRLGRNLSLQSQKRNKNNVGISVCWDDFDVLGKDLSSVKIKAIKTPSFTIPIVADVDEDTNDFTDLHHEANASRSKTGTELLITGLRQKWSEEDIEGLVQELSILISPFDRVKDFQIQVRNDVLPRLDGVLESPFFDTAELEGVFTYKSGTLVEVSITTRNRAGKRRAAKTEAIEWEQFRHRNKSKNATTSTGDSSVNDKEVSDRPSFGPVVVVLNFYPRLAETVRGTELNLPQLRDFLDINAGVKVYRDRVRVMPYGDINKAEGGDWLGLGDRKARNPAGAGRKDFRVAQNQLVGGVFITKLKNPKLIDTSGREGLVHGDEFHDLVAFMMGAIFRIEAAYHREFKKKNPKSDKVVNPRNTVKDVATQLKALETSFETVSKDFAPKQKRQLEAVVDDIAVAFESLSDLRHSMEELASQATIYRGLASLGIALTTFSHETDSALDDLSSLHSAKLILTKTPDEINKALEEIQKAIFAGDKISAWGNFALKRVKPDKRKRRMIDVTKLVAALVNDLEGAFLASDIVISSSLKEVRGRFFPMDIESVVLNLMTNAYFFAKLGRRPRRVRVGLKKIKFDGVEGIEISVADSGKGVKKNIHSEIWNPLFSTKVNDKGRSVGSGLGLTIVSDVVSDLNGEKSVETDAKINGALFKILLPLI